MAKKIKATKQPRTGFKDYPGATITFTKGGKDVMVELLRKTIIAAGGPDFPNLVLGNVALAGVREFGVFFCELATSDRKDEYLTISIAKADVDKSVGASFYQAMAPVTVRHYRGDHKYKILAAPKGADIPTEAELTGTTTA